MSHRRSIRSPIPAAVALAALAFGCSSDEGGSAGKLEYFTDWSKAVAEAEASNKPLLINYGGPW